MTSTRQGTTPTITFNLPFNVSAIQNCEIYFGQNDELLVTKGYNDCVLQNQMIQVTLKQADTLRLDPSEKTQIQMRFRYTDGAVDATGIIKIKTGMLLSGSKISADRAPADTERE